MKIIVHDYSGHPFQVQLSRELSSRGYSVLHNYSSDFLTPHGDLVKRNNDSDNLRIEGVEITIKSEKYSYIKRVIADREYGMIVKNILSNERPDVFVASNLPLDALNIAIRECVKLNIRVIYWLQDIYSIAIRRLVGNYLLGEIAYLYYGGVERSLLKKSDGIVLITEDFANTLNKWGIRHGNIITVPNWAPLDEISVKDKVNDWSLSHGIEKTFNYIYSGTLGLKHNPDILVALARRFKSNKNIRVIVITEGESNKYLNKIKTKENLDNLVVMKFQDYSVMPMVLGAADILITLLGEDAGKFSVPSKVLTYLCAKRPLLLSVPKENLSANIVTKHECGIVVDPKEMEEFCDQAEKMYLDYELRNKLGKNARKYAESNFNIGKITNRFEKLITRITKLKDT